MKTYAKKYLRPYLIVGVLTLVIGVALGYRLTKSSVGEEMWGAIIGAFSEKDLLTADGSIHLGKLFLNNVYVAVLAIFLGLCPFLYLPGAVGVINGIVIGVILGFSSRHAPGLSPWVVLAAGILPHGILELGAFVLAMAMGCNLCWTIGQLICKRINFQALILQLREGALFFLKVILPLLFLAALIETYMTPVILAWALGL